MTPTILLVRHSNTTYDSRVDALLNPPLDEKGVERLRRTREFLEDSPYHPTRILSSPLQRTLRTADIISKHNARITVHNGALPWHLGDIMGKEADQVRDTMQFLKDNPDIVAPHGESYRRFYNRWESFLRCVMYFAEVHPEDPIFITTHSRNINALQSIIGGNAVGDVEEITPEASVTLLTRNEDGDWTYQLIWDGK